MKPADPYPIIPAGTAGIQALGMEKAVAVESLSHTTMSLSHSGDTQTTYAGISNAEVGLVMHSVSTEKST